jgi:hypothetical protein
MSHGLPSARAIYVEEQGDNTGMKKKEKGVSIKAKSVVK